MPQDKKDKNLNVPPLRFPGFTDEWKDSYLSLDCEVNPKSPILEDEFVYLDLESVEKGVLIKRQVIKKVDAPSRAQRVLSDGDVLFQCVRPYQQNNYFYEVDNSGLQWVASTGYAQLRVKHSNPEFIYHLLSSPSFTRKVIVRCTGSNYPAINSEDLSSIHYRICSLPEQKKIAKLITLLDERIAAQNKIIDNLQSLIKGLIQYLIHDGIKNGSWQNIMLSEILTQRNELNTKYHPVHSVSVSAGVINQVEYLGRSFAAKDTAHYHVVNHGDIVYTKSPTGNQPYGIIKQSHCMNPAAVSPLYGVYEPVSFEVGNILHYYFLNPLNTNNYLLPLIQKGAKNTINISNQRFLENSIPFPTNNAEICCVSKMLSSIDSKIKLENNTLDTFIKQKRYLLNMLFI